MTTSLIPQRTLVNSNYYTGDNRQAIWRGTIFVVVRIAANKDGDYVHDRMKSHEYELMQRRRSCGYTIHKNIVCKGGVMLTRLDNIYNEVITYQNIRLILKCLYRTKLPYELLRPIIVNILYLC